MIKDDNVKKGFAYIAALSFMFLCGFGSVFIQSVFIREVLVISSSNELIIAACLSLWLAGIGAGAYISGKFFDFTQATLKVMVIVSALFMTLYFPIALFGVRIFRAIAGSGYNELLPIGSLLAALAVFLLPFSFILGSALPLLSRIIKTAAPEKISTSIPELYLAEAAGSIAGGLIFTFALSGRADNSAILLFFSLLVFCCIIFAGPLWEDKAVKKFMLFSYILSIILAGLYISFYRPFTNLSLAERWKAGGTGFYFAASRDTRHQNLTLGAQENFFTLYGNGSVIFNFPDDYSSAGDAAASLVFHKGPSDILLVGGSPVQLKYLEKTFLKSVDYLDIDPGILPFCLPFLSKEDQSPFSSKKIRILPGEPRTYLRNTVKKYDIISIGAGAPLSASSNRFFTVEFLNIAKKRLKAGGTLILRGRSTTNYLKESEGMLASSINGTLKSVFKRVLIIPSSPDLYIASDSADNLSSEIDTLINRYNQIKDREDFFSPLLFHTLISPDRIKYMSASLIKFKAVVNSDAKPAAHLFNIMAWDSVTGSGLGRFLKLLRNLSLDRKLFYLLTAALAAAVWLFLLILNKAGLAGKYSIITLTSGFSAISAELSVFMLFQGLYGYLYGRIALMIAFFMAGLITGALLALKYSKDKYLVFAEICFLALIACITAGVKGSPSPALLYSALLLTGALSGYEFSLCAAKTAKTSGNPGGAAGLMILLDQSGAAAGAFLSGFVFMICGGIQSVFIFLFLLKTASLFFALKKN